MNRKQLILLIGVGLLVAGLAWYLTNSRRQEFDQRDVGIGEKLLGDFSGDAIAAITIKSRDAEVTLLKKDGWVVKERSEYPAAITEISELVRKLWELKPAQSQKIGQSQWGRLDLLPPDTKDAGTNTATLVELKDKDGKAIRSLLLGKKQMRDSGGQFGGFPVGRWIAVPDNKETAFVTSEAFAETEPKVESWLSKDFFKVEKLKAISLVSTNATNSWSLSRTNETADWVLADPHPEETVDKTKLSSLNWALSSPSFTDVHPKDAEPVKDAFAAARIVRLETFEGFKYEVKIGSQPDPENFFIAVTASADLPKERTAPADEKAEDKEKNEKAWKEQQDKLKDKLKKEQALEKWVYKVAKWTVDSVLKDRSALMADKKAPDAAGAAKADGDGGDDHDHDPAEDAPLPPLPGADIQVPLAPPPPQ
jgi:hypothetical protein